MNPLFIPLDPKFISRHIGASSLWDKLARELSEEWCSLENDDTSDLAQPIFLLPGKPAKRASR